jgi:MerR family mercuric resistance operon transcriptional regulator
VARAAGIGVETVRFYERQKLLDPPPRRPSGYREFPEDVVHRLRFIRRAKELGFSLKEIGELLDLRLDPDATCADVKARADRKIEAIQEKLRDLQRMKRALAKLVAACNGNAAASVERCPILESLDHKR